MSDNQSPDSHAITWTLPVVGIVALYLLSYGPVFGLMPPPDTQGTG